MRDARAAVRADAGERRLQICMAAMRAIQRDLGARLSLVQLADEVGVSWSTLAHVFPGVVGETLWQYVRRLRLERAAYNLMSSRTASVLDVAVASGFESQAAFTRAFTRAYGCSPARFRRKPDAHPFLASPSGSHLESADAERRFKPIAWTPDRLDVRIEERPAVHVAYVRDHVEYEFPSMMRVLLRLLVSAARHGLMVEGARYYGVMHEDPYVALTGQVVYDACVSVPSDFESVGRLSRSILPAGTWACVDCEGPIDRHFASWNTFGYQWLPASPWTMSHPLAVNEYDLSGNLLRQPRAITAALLRGFASTEMLPVMPGPRGSLLPI